MRTGRAPGDGHVDPTVRFSGVSKTYPNGIEALRDVSLEIGTGDFVFIVGATGVGKSTLLKLIYREELPTRGTVSVEGRDVTRMPAREIPYLRRRVGVVFQDFRLLPRKTAWENIAFALEVTGTPPPDADRRVTELLQMVGLAARADALPRELSAGEQQRVSIARALVHGPNLLLADEPTGNLDPATSWDIVRLLAGISAGGTTVVVTTHDQTIVDRLRRRVIAIDRGAVVRDDAEGVYAAEG
ncbi:MAG TPA: cell division ATP-binding protein FtsE [bacterium]|nr:cell division ATP-binding protein FtsE [bacterium]